MAFTPCTVSNVIDDHPCFGALSQHEQDALKFYFNVIEWYALNSTAYTDGNLVDVANAITTVTKTMSPADRRHAEVTIAYHNAVAAGASVSTDIQTLRDKIKCIIPYDNFETLLPAMQCVLGVHKTFPQ